jgi:hypothetical protein
MIVQEHAECDQISFELKRFGGSMESDDVCN